MKARLLSELKSVLPGLVDPLRLAAVSGPGHDPRRNHHLEAAFRGTERTGLMLAILVRFAIIIGLVLFFALTSPMLGDGFGVLMITLFGIALIGVLQLIVLLVWAEALWPKFIFIVLDCAFLSVVLIYRHDVAGDLPPVTTALKEGAMFFFTAYLVHAAFSYSPRFVLWTGACISASCLALFVAAVTTPGVHFMLDLGGATTTAEVWRRYGDVSYLPLIKIFCDYAVIAFLTVGLAAAVWRSKRLVLAAVTAERSRTNLSRHFSPSVVDLLSQRDRALVPVCWQQAAVLFVDVRGFTAMCEVSEPVEIVQFLRDFHACMEKCVFARGGTVDKVLGDGLLAVFGVPDESHDDATRALGCALDMLAGIDTWNAERESRGQAKVQVGIGLHHGTMMLGDVGTAQMATFTVIGDTVNVANRIQELTKEKKCSLAASAALVEAVRCENSKDGWTFLHLLEAAGPSHLRGRDAPIDVFVLAQKPAEARAPVAHSESVT